MLRNSATYDQNSVRLNVEGLADFSRGQEQAAIGIISSWKLQIIGFAELEGKREHLESFIHVIMEYTRYYLVGIKKSIYSPSNNVVIQPDGLLHKLILKSSKPSIKPLEIRLDDAELVDLTRAFDQLMNDPKVKLKWNFPKSKVITKREIEGAYSIYKRFGYSTLGLISLIVFSGIFNLIPYENGINIRPREQLIESSRDINSRTER